MPKATLKFFQRNTSRSQQASPTFAAMRNDCSCANFDRGKKYDSVSTQLHGRQIQVASSFCGGCNVGINVDCRETVFIDRDENLIYLYQTFQNLEEEAVFDWIYDIIAEYGLSLVSRNGYEFYGCDSGVGLGGYNRKAFNRLREDFNNCTVVDYRYYIMIVYAFNNQIRFNSAGEFNLPVGKRDFNSRMHAKLDAFIERIHTSDCKFISDMCAAYNENDGWTERDECDLLKFLDSTHASGIRFALSNVLSSNANCYTVIHLKHSYANSNYHKTDKISESDEVLIINYDIEQWR